MTKTISKLLLRLWGWRISLPASQLPPKYVLIAVPHTSNWDFPVGLLARSALGLDIKYLGKASLFESPLGRLFRWLGGYPVDRSGGLGYVETVARIFDEHESFAICIAPEGTRRKVERLKTGFYYIALQAGVPILMAKFDWQRREIGISEPFWPSSDKVADFGVIDRFFAGVRGRYAELGYGVGSGASALS